MLCIENPSIDAAREFPARHFTRPLSERRPDMHETPVAAVYLPWRTGCTARLAARHLSRPPAFDQFNVILSIT